MNLKRRPAHPAAPDLGWAESHVGFWQYKSRAQVLMYVIEVT